MKLTSVGKIILFMIGWGIAVSIGSGFMGIYFFKCCFGWIGGSL